MDYMAIIKLVQASPELVGDLIVWLQATQVFMAKVKAVESVVPS